MKNFLIYTSIGPSANFQKTKVYGNNIADELEKQPLLSPRSKPPADDQDMEQIIDNPKKRNVLSCLNGEALCPVLLGFTQQNYFYEKYLELDLNSKPNSVVKYSCRQCGALSFVPVDICDECLKPDPEPPPPLDYYCRQCGTFAFIQIDLCDDCLKAKGKRKKRKKPARKAKAAKPPQKTSERPQKPKYEKLAIKEVERKKVDLNRVRRECDKLRFGPDNESPADKEKRLAKLETLQTEYLYLSELIGYNIGLYLDSPKPNIYKNTR